MTCAPTLDEARETLLDAAREMVASYRDEGREPPIGGGRVESVEIDLANPARDSRTPVPRHLEIPTGTARAICRRVNVHFAPPRAVWGINN